VLRRPQCERRDGTEQLRQPPISPSVRHVLRRLLHRRRDGTEEALQQRGSSRLLAAWRLERRHSQPTPSLKRVAPRLGRSRRSGAAFTLADTLTVVLAAAAALAAAAILAVAPAIAAAASSARRRSEVERGDADKQRDADPLRGWGAGARLARRRVSVGGERGGWGRWVAAEGEHSPRRLAAIR